MKLSTWAKQQGVSYRTAWSYFHDGQIPGAKQLPTGTIIVPTVNEQVKKNFVVTYARVSSSQNKSNLVRQSKRLVQYCNARGWETHLNIQEVGSGLNDRRRKLLKVLQEGKATKLVVEHKDRLTRFGFTYIEALCQHIGCELVVLNNTKGNKEDLVQDFVSVVTSFCARLYGQRRSKRATEKLIKELDK